MWVVLKNPEHFKMMMIEKDIELDETIMFWKEMPTHTCKSKNKRLLQVSKSHRIVYFFFSNAPTVVINHKIIAVNTNTYVAMFIIIKLRIMMCHVNMLPVNPFFP
jgi:hypothetical protein